MSILHHYSGTLQRTMNESSSFCNGLRTKGQLVSKCLFGVFKSPKKIMKFL